MVNSRIMLSGLGVLALSGSVLARDAVLKGCWVSQSILEQTAEGRMYGEQVTGKQRQLAQDLETKQKLWADAANKLREEMSMLSEEVRLERSEYVAKLERDYKEAAQKAERTMQMEVQKVTQEAYKSFAVAAEDFAKKKGYDVVWSESGVLYVNKEVDASAEVAKIMNDNYEVKLAQNKKLEKPAESVKTAAVKTDAKKADATVVAKKSEKADEKKAENKKSTSVKA